MIDEAYAEFGSQNILDLIKQYSNLLILRTFSKAFGLASARIGYLIGLEEIVSQIVKVIPPYNQNSFSEIIAIFILSHYSEIKRRIDEICSERERIFKKINGVSGWKAWPSEANFLLFEGPFSAKEIFSKLLKNGILVRDVSQYPLLESKLRVTVGAREENDIFLNTITKMERYPIR